MMEHERREYDIIGTKLDILIDDFKEFKGKQETANEKLNVHMLEEEKLVASLTTTINWHTVIGTFMVGIIMFLIFSHVGGK
jgi:hypothetical protein